MRESTAEWVVAVDVRCLQDQNYAERGVGRHALSLLRGKPESVRLIGVTDLNLPPLMAEAEALLDRVCPTAYAAEVAAQSGGRQLSAFISLSPMTHDPLFTARLVANAALLRAAVVYDFIPRHEPERYLSGTVARVQYATALTWLGRCDLFAPIRKPRASNSAAFGVPPSASFLTGASIDPKFEGIAQGQSVPTHFLVVGGGDPRKNPEVVVRAHARRRAVAASGYSARDRRELWAAGRSRIPQRGRRMRRGSEAGAGARPDPG